MPISNFSKLALVCLALSAGIMPVASQASVVIEFDEVGPNVVATGRGTLDLTAFGNPDETYSLPVLDPTNGKVTIGATNFLGACSLRSHTMVGSITTVRIKDPHEITPAMWERFAPTPTSAITPSQFRARLYRAGDWQRFARDRHAFETTVSVGKLGQICFVRMEDRDAMNMSVASRSSMGAPGRSCKRILGRSRRMSGYLQGRCIARRPRCWKVSRSTHLIYRDH